MDGVSVSLTTVGSDSVSNVGNDSRDMTIGVRLSTNSQYFDGSLSLPIILSGNPSAPEILELQTPRQPDEYSAGLQAKYLLALPLNDGVVDPYVDRSANGNDGTASGSPIFTTPTLEFAL